MASHHIADPSSALSQRLRRWEGLMPYLTDDGRVLSAAFSQDERRYRFVWRDGMMELLFVSELGVAGYVRCRTDLGDPPLYVEVLPQPEDEDDDEDGVDEDEIDEREDGPDPDE